MSDSPAHSMPERLRYQLRDLAAGISVGTTLAAGTRLDTTDPGTLCALDGRVTHIHSLPSPTQGRAQIELSIAVAPHQTTQAAGLLPPIDLAALGANADSRTTLLQRIQSAAICGLGGGRYPAAAKLGGLIQCAPLIINGMQSDPDNESDLWLATQDPQGIACGIALTAVAANAETILIGFPQGSDPAIAGALMPQLERAFATLGWAGDARLKYLPADATSGAETLLAESIADLRVPLNRPLAQSGALSVNLATAYAIGRAVVTGEPLLRRVVTVAGTPRWVWLGTPVTDLLPAPCVLNGRLAGDAAPPNAAIHAGHFCLDSASEQPSYGCINCSRCVPVCPAALRPDLLHKALLGDIQAPAVIDRVSELAVDQCIECGACNAVCPSHIALAQRFRQARRVCATKSAQQAAAAQAKARVDARTQRLARRAQDQEAARAARERAPRAW